MSSVSCVSSEGVAAVDATPERVAKVLGMFIAARAANHLSASMAGKFVATWAPLFHPTMASQPLVQRDHYDGGATTWTEELEQCRLYLATRLPMLLSAGPIPFPMEQSTEPPLLVYSDAAFHCVGDEPVAELGSWVYDPRDGTEVAAFLILPASYYAHLARDKRTYVMQAELIAAIAVFFTLPERCRGRAVLHFIDNTGALSALVHGYASKGDRARMVNAFHIALFGLRSHIHFVWVPSAANISDWCTRPDMFHKIPPSTRFVEMVIPSSEQLDGDLASSLPSPV